MAEPAKNEPMDLGIYSQSPSRPRVTVADYIAIILSLAWLVGAGVFFLMMRQPEGGLGLDPLTFVMVLLAVFLPVALIWVGAAAARSSRIMREESARLQAAIDAMRQTYVAQAQAGAGGITPTFARKLDEIASAQKSLAKFTSTRQALPEGQRPAIAPTGGPDDQATLELGTRAEDLAPPVSTADFIRALHFPETAEDEEGFRALRRALQDRTTARLVQASQDVLTLLSQDGIYMDDLKPDRARPELWRKLARGERGRAIAGLGGIRDRSCLALTAGRMKTDTIFRDAAHHFLREFDKTFVEFEKDASDNDIAALAETRTARAFMLLGRVTGTFD